jgi:hypothetical protein
MKLSLGSLLARVDRSWKSMHAVCGLRTCRNTLIMRSVPESRVGIRMGQLWYCSVDCFVKAARARFSTLSMARNVEIPHSPRLSIGLVMLSKGYLSDEQLRFAVAEGQSSGEELEVVLLRMGLANEWQLAAAKAVQWGYPVLGRDRISKSVDADIPVTLLRTFSAVPLHYSVTAKRLLLGFVDRVENSLLHSVEQITGCKAEPCFITRTEFREQMERVTAAPNYTEVVVEDALTPAQTAKAVGGFAIEIGAREATFASCQDYAWMRLSGKRRTIDVLFRGRNVVEAEPSEIFLASGEHIRYLK